MNHHNQNKIADYWNFFCGTRFSAIFIFAFIYCMWGDFFCVFFLILHELTVVNSCFCCWYTKQFHFHVRSTFQWRNPPLPIHDFSHIILNETNAFLCCLTSICDNERCRLTCFFFFFEINVSHFVATAWNFCSVAKVTEQENRVSSSVWTVQLRGTVIATSRIT